MPPGSDLPEVLPAASGDEYECVLADPEAAQAPGAGTPAAGLCPPGYVPRLKRRASYEVHGKEAVVDRPPERNPRRDPGPTTAHDPEGSTGDARS